MKRQKSSAVRALLARRRPGMALVVSIMTAFILVALLVSLFLVVSTTQRQADFSRNAAIALNLAEAGVADAIYRLNYGLDGDYPFNDSENPFGFSELLAGPFPAPLPGGLVHLDPWLGGELNDGEYYACVLDGEPQRIVGAGFYNNTWRVLSVDLRGVLDAGEDRQSGMGGLMGIADAFNRKAVYARDLEVGAGSVDGNIARVETAGPEPVGGDYTITGLDPAVFAVPVVDAAMPAPAVPPAPDYQFYLRDGERYNTWDDVQNEENAEPLPPGITLDGAFYLFSGLAVGDSYYVFDNRGVRFSGAVTVSAPMGTSAGDFEATAAAELTISGGNAVFDVGGDRFAVAGGARVTGAGGGALRVWNGRLAAFGGQYVNAPVVTNRRVDITGPITVTDDSSPGPWLFSAFQDDLAITDVGVYVDAGVDIQGDLDGKEFIFLAHDSTPGENGRVEITINGSVTVPDAWAGTMAAAFSRSGTRGRVSVHASLGAPGRGFLFYAHAHHLNSRVIIDPGLGGLVHGKAVTNGTVELRSGTLVQEDDAFFGADMGADIYPGFSGGRRVYVPRPASWRLY